MPRRARLDFSDTVYHIYARGNNKLPIFTVASDYERFLRYLMQTKQEKPFLLLAFCLMPNHYHLQIKTQDPSLAKIMHALNGEYASYFNFQHNRVGHLFQNRYHSIPVWDEMYMQRLNRYIHLNPVAARITPSPDYYRWSSYAEYFSQRPTYIVREPILELFGDDLLSQQSNFSRYTQEGMAIPLEFNERVLLRTRSFGDNKMAEEVRLIAPLGPSPILGMGPVQ